MFPQIFGKYVLEREIAAGGMARVFLATLRGAGGVEKRLVVKQIRPELASDQGFIRRFVVEAKTTVELSHANIVPVYEFGAEQGTYYIAMEYCDGVPLSRLLAAGPLSPLEGAYIGVEICRALDYAHRKAHIVHRDVTPRNVMIDGEGMVRLIDFGIAGAAEIEDGQEPLFGSPGHMPPEQLNGGALSPASDVFAVAVLLIEAWTGRAPFRRDTFEESVAALDQPPPDIAESDLELAPLSELISAAISLDPARRPQSAEELARPLREFLRRADTGDIARALGRRVSNCIGEEEAERAPITAPHEPEHPLAAGQTQTFAARDVLLEWTAKIDSHPPRPSRRSLAPAMPSESPAPAPSSSPVLVEGRNAGPSSGPGASRYRVLLTAAAIVAAALGSVQLLTGTFDAGSAERDARRSNPSALDSEPTTRAVSLSAEPAPPAPAAAPPSNREAPAPERAGVPPAAAPPSSPPTASVAAARVDFTAEPPAIVKLDGTSLGRTPRFAVTVSEGSHQVVFASELLGEQIETTLRIGAGRERKRVHADFTSAAPRVHVR